MVGLLNDCFGGTQCVAEDEIGEVGMLQGHGAQEQGLFLGSNPQGHAAIVFHGYSGHDTELPLYTFKWYNNQGRASHAKIGRS